MLSHRAQRHSSCVRQCHVAALLVGAALLSGCGKPNAANIELRKQNQQLLDDVNRLTQQNAALGAQLRVLEQDEKLADRLPQERLDRLFTTGGLRIERLTIGEDLDKALPGDEGFKVTFSPTDQFGDGYKAAGAARIELFDLTGTTPQRIGDWQFDTPALQRKWISSFVLEGYVIEERWQTPPTQPRLMVKVTFVDELTGRTFDATRELTVRVGD